MLNVTTPDDFDPIFRQGVLVVGGHAVNLWGSFYAHRGSQSLQQFAPFISKDGDIYLRDKAMAVAVAATAGWSFRDNPDVRSPVLGHIYLLRGREELRIDVLHTVTGVTAAELAATEELRFQEGRVYVLPAPDILLKAKLANLALHSRMTGRTHGMCRSWWPVVDIRLKTSPRRRWRVRFRSAKRWIGLRAPCA